MNSVQKLSSKNSDTGRVRARLCVGDQVIANTASSGDYWRKAMETTPSNSYPAVFDWSWDGVSLNKMAKAKSCNPIRIRNRNTGALVHAGYVIDVVFTGGHKNDQRLAKRRIAQFASQTILRLAGRLAVEGTLIEWPWGDLGCNSVGCIRVCPRAAGHPVDGKDAKYNSNVRGGSGRCFLCQRRDQEPAFKVR